MSPKLKQIAFVVWAMFMLSSCIDGSFNQCIDPDDFGFPKMAVPARGTNVTNIGSTSGNQVSQWIDSNLMLNGQELAILVRNGTNSQWAAWFGGPAYPDSVPPFLQSANFCTPNPLFQSHFFQIPTLVGARGNNCGV